jgi:hypothetical protein
MGGMPESLRVFGGAERLDELLESLSAAVFGDADLDHLAPDAQPRAPS